MASQYSANEMCAEAPNTYQVIVKNKMFSNAGRLKVNMGNIYLKQRNYSKAIKFYQIALDQIPSVHKEMRIKIMQNIGVTFIKTGQGASLVAQWLRICLPMRGTRVRALVWEDPTYRGATKPVRHNYWACASGYCAPQWEAATVRGTRTAMKSGPHLPQLEKAHAQKRRPNTVKNK